MGMVGSALGVTIQLAAATLVLATAIGVPLGILAAIYEGRAPDRIVQAFNLLGLAAPVFWIGLMLLVGMSSSFDWSPPLMYVPLHELVSENLSIIALPVLSLALLQAAAYSQFVRQSIVSALGQDYVRTAVAKGLSTRTVFFRHLLRNIGIPLVTFMGLILIQILGGAVIIESLFALPGLGRLLLSSIETRDYPVLQAGLLVVVVIAMLVNLVVDLSYHRASQALVDGIAIGVRFEPRAGLVRLSRQIVDHVWSDLVPPMRLSIHHSNSMFKSPAREAAHRVRRIIGCVWVRLV
ncbi:ABC transporter permease [Bosea thiooxidans]